MLECLRLAVFVMLRHWQVYRKDFIANISTTIVEPVLFMLSMGLGLGHYLSEVQGQSYAAYLAPGLAMAAALFTSFFETSYNVYIRFQYDKVYQAMLTTPIGVREIIVGELLWVTAKAAVMSTVVTIVFVFFGVAKIEWLFLVPFAGALVGLACGSLGLISTTLIRNINQFQTVYSFMIAPMFFLSGIFFPVEDLPAWLMPAVFLSPLFYGVKITQSLYWQTDLLYNWMVFGGGLVLFGVMITWVAYRRVFRMFYY